MNLYQPVRPREYKSIRITYCTFVLRWIVVVYRAVMDTITSDGTSLLNGLQSSARSVDMQLHKRQDILTRTA